MKLIDTKTGKPWPSVMANLKLEEIREGCRNDLRERDESRGIVDGKLTDTLKAEGAGKDAKTKDVVNAAKQAAAHTGTDFQRLLLGRWADWCAEPRDLLAFMATTKTSEKLEHEAAVAAGAGVQKSLDKELDAKPEKRGAGRPKKEVAVEA